MMDKRSTPETQLQLKSGSPYAMDSELLYFICFESVLVFPGLFLLPTTGIY